MTHNSGEQTSSCEKVALCVLQIAGMKLETDNAPPVQRHSAPSAAIGNPEGPVQKLVTAALRQSAPAVKVTSQLLSHLLALVNDILSPLTLPERAGCVVSAA